MRWSSRATLAIAVVRRWRILIVALGLIGAVVDDHLAARSQSEAERLRAHIAELEVTKSTLEHTSRSLILARDAADAANRAKSSFLAAMSHELRTPLNAVIGFSELMAMETFGPLGHKRYQDYSKDIHGSGVHLLALINDILDLSRIDAGEGVLGEEDARSVSEQREPVGAPGRASGRGRRRRAGAELARPDPRADPRRQAPLEAGADQPARQRGQVHAREQRIAVVRAGVVASAGGIEIAVTDTGIGIAARDIPRALERLGQRRFHAWRANTKAPASACRSPSRLVEMHGGTLTLESTLDVAKSDCVTIALPASRIVADAATQAA